MVMSPEVPVYKDSSGEMKAKLSVVLVVGLNLLAILLSSIPLAVY